MRRIIYILMMPLLVVSCEWFEQGGDISEAVQFSMVPMADDANSTYSTYSIIAYTRDVEKDNNFQYRGSGSYYWYDGAGDFLIPGTVADDGTAMPDENKAMHGSFGEVWITCVSPATTVTDGYIPYNSTNTPDDRFMCSPPEESDVSGYGKIRILNPLVDTRSWLVFNFYGGLDEEGNQVGYEIKDSKVSVKGFGDANPVMYYPATSQVKYTTETTGRQYTLSSASGTTTADDNERVLLYSTDAYVPAGFYGPKSEVEKALRDQNRLSVPSAYVLNTQYMTLNFSMVQNSTAKAISIPLTAVANGNVTEVKELEPRYKYVYNVVVKSVYVSVSVEIYSDWVDVPLDTEISPVETELVGTWELDSDGNWSQIDLGTTSPIC